MHEKKFEISNYTKLKHHYHQLKWQEKVKFLEDYERQYNGILHNIYFIH